MLQIQKWRRMSPRADDKGVRVLEEADGVTWAAMFSRYPFVVNNCGIGERYLGL